MLNPTRPKGRRPGNLIKYGSKSPSGQWINSLLLAARGPRWHHLHIWQTAVWRPWLQAMWRSDPTIGNYQSDICTSIYQSNSAFFIFVRKCIFKRCCPRTVYKVCCLALVQNLLHSAKMSGMKCLQQRFLQIKSWCEKENSHNHAGWFEAGLAIFYVPAVFVEDKAATENRGCGVSGNLLVQNCLQGWPLCAAKKDHK